MKGHITLLVIAASTVLTPKTTPAQTRRHQPAFEFCVTSPDTSWRPVSLGFDTDNSITIRNGGVKERGYPVIRNVEAGSVADSAGIRDGDVWRAIDHHDFRRDTALAKVHGPGVPIVMTIARGDSVFDRRVVPGPAKPSRCTK